MTQSTLESRGNRRETLLWIGTATVMLAILAAVAMLGLYAVPTAPLVEIGHVYEFPPGQPPRLITVGNQQIFVVRLAGEVVAYDPRVIKTEYLRCPIQWVPPQNRFEDPCGGSKFEIDGTWIEGPAPRDLDRYPVTITEDGTVLVEMWRTIKGKTHPCIDPINRGCG